jgi:hypothetical protein
MNKILCLIPLLVFIGCYKGGDRAKQKAAFDHDCPKSIIKIVNSNKVKSKDKPPIPEVEIKYETTDGTTLSGITVGKSTLEDVLKKHGNNYVKNYNSFSTHIIYKTLGLTFYYKTNDRYKIIFNIEAKYPYKLKTLNGIILNKSRMLDVKKVYGKLNWETTTDDDYWRSDHNGIIFYVLRDKTFPQFPLNEKLHINKVIKVIDLDSRYRRGR